MWFWCLVAVSIACFRAHWCKATPLKSEASYVLLESRELFNAHCCSALVYAASAVYAAVHGQLDLAMLCLGTFLSCSAYHLSHETRFFNLDFLFAAATGFVFLWTLLLAAPLGDLNTHLYVDCCTPSIVYTQCGILALPIGLLLFVGCGMPSEISEIRPSEKKTASPYLQVCTHCRGDSVVYNWCDNTSPQFRGFTMGVAPLEIGADVSLPTVPLCSLLAALLLNLMGNALGVMPIQ